eukprot:TRINITY_DN3608_c0_g1_i3.p1 TRINITY_DN3608_c0_g1~~TRINITY_DN3608_c0_g1_i3.p1  ORF type:complete len:417 (+),score=83.58 TRINITY_DN3608_c0_g1_i3:56-1306(+)
MSELDDSFVVRGSRRNLPQLHVEQEDFTPASLRNRKESSTPDTERTYTLPVDGTPIFPSTPNPKCPPSQRPVKKTCSPTLQDLKEGRVELDKDGSHDTKDSGYSGWKYSASVAKKNLRFEGDGNPNGSYIDGEKAGNSVLWDSFTSPVLDIKKKLYGKPSFLDSPIKKKKLQPQQLLAGIVLLVMISSICFAILIGVTHLATTKQELDGKRKAVWYGTEKKLENLKAQGKLLDRDLLDADGTILGGKRASIQYALETMEESLPDHRLASLTKQSAKASDHMDVYDLLSSIQSLQQIILATEDAEKQLLHKVSDLLADNEQIVVDDAGLFKDQAEGEVNENYAVAFEMEAERDPKILELPEQRDADSSITKSMDGKGIDIKAPKTEPRSSGVPKVKRQTGNERFTRKKTDSDFRFNG